MAEVCTGRMRAFLPEAVVRVVQSGLVPAGVLVLSVGTGRTVFICFAGDLDMRLPAVPQLLQSPRLRHNRGRG